MILVMFNNGRCGKVPPPILGRLIASGEVTHFWRTDGWVEVSRGPLRKTVRPLYSGREKRSDWRTNLD